MTCWRWDGDDDFSSGVSTLRLRQHRFEDIKRSIRVYSFHMRKIWEPFHMLHAMFPPAQSANGCRPRGRKKKKERNGFRLLVAASVPMTSKGGKKQDEGIRACSRAKRTTCCQPVTLTSPSSFSFARLQSAGRGRPP